ncbi:hypothetical protein BC833DRAFT_581295 [Globomyces pollinis-pini]|nr:hypothetical protein BC833DRAFT_581295 [Globomyces pollinis-pini]
MLSIFLLFDWILAFSLSYSINHSNIITRGSSDTTNYKIPKNLLSYNNNNTLYKVVLNHNDIEIYTTIPLCLLHEADFNEFLTVHLDDYGNPFHLDIQVAAKSCTGKISKATHFNTQFVSLSSNPGPRPLLSKPVVYKEGETPPQPFSIQGFFMKYWYIIVPALLFILFTEDAPPEKK